jgi:hypothetical protein
MSSDALGDLADQPACCVIGDAIEHPWPVPAPREKPVTVKRVQATRGITVFSLKRISQLLHRRLTILQRQQHPDTQGVRKQLHPASHQIQNTTRYSHGRQRNLSLTQPHMTGLEEPLHGRASAVPRAKLTALARDARPAASPS